MDFPHWAPKELVERYHVIAAGDLTTEEEEFRAAFERVLLSPALRKTWEALARSSADSEKQDAADAHTVRRSNAVRRSGAWHVLRRAEICLDEWRNTPKKTRSEVAEELDEIEHRARKLAVMLGELSHDPLYLQWHRLLSQEETDAVIRAFHPDLVAAFTRRPMHSTNAPIQALDAILPSLSTLLLRLADLANDADRDRPRDLPRKMHGDGAQRTYFIKVIGTEFFMWGVKTPSDIAAFCSLFLDDLDITSDLVRKQLPEDFTQSKS